MNSFNADIDRGFVSVTNIRNFANYIGFCIDIYCLLQIMYNLIIKVNRGTLVILKIHTTFIGYHQMMNVFVELKSFG